MHRFRKKSETTRSGQAPPAFSSDSEEQDNSLQVPLPSDFRTSLILPDLSRRFSLLRSSSGEPVALDVLRSRLADQRARGAANHISEEEEEMIFDTLRNFRSKPSGSAQQSSESVSALETDDFRQSTSTVQSSTPSSTSVTSSPTGRGAKRYSNNLFGSGRFNDYNYMRSVTKNGSTRTQSLTPTESSYRANTSSVVDSLRPVTPESSGFSSSNQSSPSLIEKTHSVRSAPLVAPVPYGEQGVSVAEYRISKKLGSSVLKRASMAIEEAIKEFEEEADDEILMPRSTPIPRGHVEIPPSDPARNSLLSHSSIFEAVMAISSDKQVQNDPEVIDRRASPVPSRILPGYVPGMPRPMTPRDFDVEEQRSLSTTPRATSPMAASFADTSLASIPNISATGRRRSNSSASQSGGRSPTSPLFLQRSPNSGRYTPEDSSRNATEFDCPLNSSLLARRRPASPLAGPPYQPMAVSSRPSTPSNIVWNTSASQNPSGHTRNDSWASDSGMSNSDVHGAYDRYTSGPRLLRSPPLPDSPTEGGSFSLNSRAPTSYDSSTTTS
ncbi:hypothetical protein FPV67DRAFT_286113 [Lyophyllum atratum]|nr:hypothetical protein FPV67DRAFT_286113 [Lyophyllum atratum]